jgi:hypothetical protein
MMMIHFSRWSIYFQFIPLYLILSSFCNFSSDPLKYSARILSTIELIIYNWLPEYSFWDRRHEIHQTNRSKLSFYVYVYRPIYIHKLICFVSVRFIIVITKITVPLATNSLALTRCRTVGYAVDHGRVSDILFRCIVSAMWIPTLLWYRYVKVSIVHKWDFNDYLCVLFVWDSVKHRPPPLGLNWIPEKAGEVDSTKSYNTNGKNSRWIANGC